MRNILLLCSIFMCCCLACATFPRMQEQAQQLGFKQYTFAANNFAYTGFMRLTGGSNDLVVYVEGDGRAFVGNQVNNDPSPRRPLAFALAMADPAPNVLYLARLGQYNQAYTGPAFSAYWAQQRFAPEIIQSMNQAVEQAKTLSRATRLHLIGYSGGGAVVCLLAAKRQDVSTLITVAGLLDIDWWVRDKNLIPLRGSLNPGAYASQLAAIPQIHFYGRQDQIISPAMHSYFAGLANFSAWQAVGLDFNHQEGWAEQWPNLLAKYVLPLRQP